MFGLGPAWELGEVAVDVLVVRVAEEHAIGEEIEVAFQWRPEKRQYRGADECKLRNRQAERLAITMGMEHVVARIDETTYLDPVDQLRQVNSPGVLAEPMHVQKHEPHVGSLFEDRTDRVLHEFEIEVSQPPVAAKNDRVVRNAKLGAQVVINVRQ